MPFRAGGNGRGRHDLRVLGQLKPFPVTRLEGGIVPQRALSGWRKTKLGRELPEAASDAGQLVRDRVGPAQVVYGSAFTAFRSTNLTKRAPYA